MIAGSPRRRAYLFYCSRSYRLIPELGSSHGTGAQGTRTTTIILLEDRVWRRGVRQCGCYSLRRFGRFGSVVSLELFAGFEGRYLRGGHRAQWQNEDTQRFLMERIYVKMWMIE